MAILRALLVDDEEELVSTLKERMEFRDIDADYVLDGNEAAAMVKKGSYDVVVLDVMMPAVHGLEVLTDIRAVCPEIPVILLTGRGSVEDSKAGLKLGAVDYLVKPVKIDVLIEKMMEAAGKGQ